MPQPSGGSCRSRTVAWSGGVQSPKSHVPVCVSHQPGSVKRPTSVIGVHRYANMSGPASTVGATLRTVTVFVSTPTPPSSSRTRTVTVYVPLSQKACDAFTTPLPSGALCVSVSVPTSGAELSPKSNVTVCVSTQPGSVNVAVNSVTAPSLM